MGGHRDDRRVARGAREGHGGGRRPEPLGGPLRERPPARQGQDDRGAEERNRKEPAALLKAVLDAVLGKEAESNGKGDEGEVGAEDWREPED